MVDWNHLIFSQGRCHSFSRLEGLKIKGMLRIRSHINLSTDWKGRACKVGFDSGLELGVESGLVPQWPLCVVWSGGLALDMHRGRPLADVRRQAGTRSDHQL